MKYLLSILLIFCVFLQSIFVPVLALELDRPDDLGWHADLIHFELTESGQTDVKIPDMEFFPVAGQTLYAWAVGGLIYVASILTINLISNEFAWSPAAKEIMAYTMSIAGTAWAAWSIGNITNTPNSIEGDYSLTLAGALLGQILFIITSNMTKNNYDLKWLDYVNWSFSGLGASLGYHLSRQKTPTKAMDEKNAASRIQN